MPAFWAKDREWKIKLNYGLIEHIKESIGVDFDQLIDSPEEFGSLLLKTPKKLIELLWALCEEQATEQKISPKEFGYLFDRPTLDKATNAVMEAILDFYPRSSVGRAMRERLPLLLKAVDDKLEIGVGELMDKRLEEISSEKATV